MQKIIVLGGGAAGFFAAINIPYNNNTCSVIILEKSNKLLSKVRISGGGRCNVTHSCYEIKELSKNYPRGEKELIGPFSRFSVKDTIEWFEKKGVKIKKEEDGRMFPVSDNSETIIDCLMEQAHKYNVTIKTGVEIKHIKKVNEHFVLETVSGNFECDKLIIATGGNYKTSSYNILTELGHTINEPVPSLFTFNIPNNALTSLQGVSVARALVKISGYKLETHGPVLITHWGLSGPAVLRLSAIGAKLLHQKKYDFTASINWLNEMRPDDVKNILLNHKKNDPSKKIINLNSFDIPNRLWKFILLKCGINDTLKTADLSNKQINKLADCFCSDNYQVTGKTTFKEEFVTCGGVSLKEVDMKTMQSKLVSGLFFAGEVLNIDGITGGFNFQNAWTTGWIAAQQMQVQD